MSLNEQVPDRQPMKIDEPLNGVEVGDIRSSFQRPNIDRWGVALCDSHELLRKRVVELEAIIAKLKSLPAQIEYRYEPHGSIVDQRATMERLGLDGWGFVAFVDHWGPSDGKTMLFLRSKPKAQQLLAWEPVR